MLLQELFLLLFFFFLSLFFFFFHFHEFLWSVLMSFSARLSKKILLKSFFFFSLFLSPKVMKASEGKKVAPRSISPHTFLPTMHMQSSVPILLRNLWLQGTGMKLKLHRVKCYFLYVKGFQLGHFWVLFRFWIGLHLWQKLFPQLYV